jgi:HD-like signal output (HDOD) protein
MANLAVQIEQEVTQAMDRDELELPSLPEVALRILDEAENVHAANLATWFAMQQMF